MDVFRCGEKRSCSNNTHPKFTQSLTLLIHAGKTPVPKRVPSSSISGSPSKGKNKSTMLSVPIFSFWKLPSYMKTASHCHCHMGPVKRLCPRQGTTSCSQRSPSLESELCHHCLRLERSPSRMLGTMLSVSLEQPSCFHKNHAKYHGISHESSCFSFFLYFALSGLKKSVRAVAILLPFVHISPTSPPLFLQLYIYIFIFLL